MIPLKVLEDRKRGLLKEVTLSDIGDIFHPSTRIRGFFSSTTCISLVRFEFDTSEECRYTPIQCSSGSGEGAL